MADWADDHLDGEALPWDLADQIDDLERQVARQARSYREMRAAMEQADFLLGPSRDPRADG